ncbi:apolipoprotein N-acyltransferase [Treponema pedis]|uniref:apolipoprotein N-acyltransferase n=1 Tax=Treponema pedis TaxID=409322 RepID=UPI00040A2941|nr:apolipoprotein N-acyltransferase [Treponema pedis]
MHFFLFFSAILCSSLLFSLGIPNEFFNFGSAAAGFSALALVYYVFLNCGSYKRAAILYGIFAACVQLFASYWLAFFEDFAIFTLGASTAAYFFLALPFGISLHYVLKQNKITRMFGFAAVWLMWEYFKSNDFLAYPWGTSPMVCFNLKHFIQFADTTGVWGLSFAVPLISACLGEFINAYSFSVCKKQFFKNLAEFRKPFFFVAGLVFLFNIYGIIVLNKNIMPLKTLNTVIVQQNGDPWDMSNFEEYLRTSQNLTKEAVSKAPKQTNLVIWSENSLAIPYSEGFYYYDMSPESDPFSSFLKNLNVPLFTGSPYENNGKSYNSACLISPDGKVSDIYSKIQLVAFAEYIPFIDNPLVVKLFDTLVGFSSGWTPGSEFKLFSVKNSAGENIKFAAPICFEDAFPNVCVGLHNLGSELLVNMSNDSWSKTASAEYQHFVVSYYRAIELRTTLVRSTNSGFSAVVDPYGRVLYTMPLFKAVSGFFEIPIYGHTKTPFAIFKDWFPALIFTILMLLMAVQWITSVKKKASAPLPSSHWKEHKKNIKFIRRYKPLFSVKRYKRQNK